MRAHPALTVRRPAGLDAEAFDEQLLTALVDAGASAVEHDPDHEDDLARVFFFTADARDRAANAIAAALPGTEIVAIDVPDEGWAARSQAAITAVTVDRLTVAPPWDVPVDAGAVVIIQPSTGFGTAHHASTRLCLRLLQRHPLAGARVFDVGTGSGVLALAARRLGAHEVVGADFDPDAIDNAVENLGLNGLTGDDVAFAPLDLFDAASVAAFAGRTFDVVLANLTGGLLVAQAATLARWVAPGGRLIMSGVLLEEEARVTAAFVAAGLTCDDRLSEQEWAGLSWRR